MTPEEAAIAEQIAYRDLQQFLHCSYPSLYGGGGGAGGMGTATIFKPGAVFPAKSPTDLQIIGDTLFYKNRSFQAKPYKAKPKKPNYNPLMWKLIGLASLILLIGWYYMLWWAFA